MSMPHLRRLAASTLLLVASLALATAQSESPRIAAVDPAPGFVHRLERISVTFTEPVSGVTQDDLLINGVPAEGVSGTGATYLFTFPQPSFGPVDIAWGPLHSIFDLQTPPQRFDAGAPGSTWAYQLTDPSGPHVTNALPTPGSLLRRLAQVQVSFTEPVTGVRASDLRLNDQPATSVVGVGAGPYVFTFPAAGAGAATVTWAAGHAIASDEEAPIPFAGGTWGYRVDPDLAAPKVLINEILTENQSGLLDEDGDAEDWIELFNADSASVNLAGWALSVDREEEGQWVFPPIEVPARGYLLVWASGKDRRSVSAGKRAHTNFKLNANGDTLRLFGPELPRTLVDELKYPEQAPDHAYGRQPAGGDVVWRHFAEPSPESENSLSTITGKVAEVHFSVERGFFKDPFTLSLACPTAAAEIRYTLDGSSPLDSKGLVYSAPIVIGTNRVVRAAATAKDQLPSRVRTHTYLMNLATNRRLLPVVSLVTGTNYLYGRNGIMESNPRNTTKHGAAWERPVSIEWIRPEDNNGFQLDAGLRVAGGDYIRQRYNPRVSTPPEGKYSFRLYFRGDYGQGRLKYPVFPSSTVESFNTLHLRAGMNDHSNPFIKDEFVRELSLDVGLAACHGTFVYLFLNGVYKGLYNPCERVDDDFLQAYHGGGELWDVIGPNNQVIRGDSAAWSQLRTAVRKDLTIATNYLDVAGRMDLTNFVDYLLPLIWADNDDWPHNNTRAAREKIPGAPFRFYPWDAEFAFTSHQVSYDTIVNTLSTLSPPWGTTDYQAMFNSLKKSYEFKLLFADRVHRAFYNDGPLADASIRQRYELVRGQVVASIPGFNNVIGSWISNRRRYLTNIFARSGFLASSNAPVASQFGGRVPTGYALTLQNLAGTIYYTTNGADPRTAFTSAPEPSALAYGSPIVIQRPALIKARSLSGTNWSALTALRFEVAQIGSPIRLTEIMFDPPGGVPFEYLELQNTGGLPVNLSGYSFAGIDFRFREPFPPLGPGERIILANGTRPDLFKQRYPSTPVAGWFTGSLDNGGERLTLLDPNGGTVVSVAYSDTEPWPQTADGGGASLESRFLEGDPNDPANWQASLPGGSPGLGNHVAPPARVRLNEFQAGTDGDWIELHNPGTEPVDVSGWSLTDNEHPRQYIFPAGTSLGPDGFVVVDCQRNTTGPLIAPFQLNRHGETIVLYDRQTNRVDALTYGAVADGYTIGWVEGDWRLCQATPHAANAEAVVGPLTAVRINEFLANGDGADDWIELHNTGILPVSLQGCSMTTSNGFGHIAAATFINPGAFVVLTADEKPGPDHLSFKLPASGGAITLLAPNGEELDATIYGPQAPGISSGRLPDGTGSWQPLPYSPTPGGSNYIAELGSRLRIGEFLARAQPGPDWVEVENVSDAPIALGGFQFEIEVAAVRQTHPFHADRRLNAGERMLIYLGPVPPTFTPLPNSETFDTPLADEGALLMLRDALGRIIDRVEYGAQITNRSAGRFGQNWVLLGAPSPGQPNGGAAAVDSGSQLRLNEWLAGGGGTNDFVEIYNPAVLPVNLTGWNLTDDPSIVGATNRQLSSLTFIDGGGFLRFHTDGQHAPGHLPFGLDVLGETIRLLNPNGVVIDSVNYRVQLEAVSEGRYPDGAALIVAFPGSATPGAANIVPAMDQDKDGMDDTWERAYGLNPADPADAFADLDGDGQSNLTEFRSGTDPSNPSSLFQISVAVTAASGQATIRFLAAPGRTYTVQYADQLTPAHWASLAQVPANSAWREVLTTDPAAVPERSSRFYRVLTQP